MDTTQIFKNIEKYGGSRSTVRQENFTVEKGESGSYLLNYPGEQIKIIPFENLVEFAIEALKTVFFSN